MGSIVEPKTTQELLDTRQLLIDHANNFEGVDKHPSQQAQFQANNEPATAGPEDPPEVAQFGPKADGAQSSTIQISDFVGEHGAYQMFLTIILFVRYIFLGLMANSGPLLTPDVTFYCDLPRAEVLAIMPNISLLSEREQELEIKEEFKRICQIDLHLYQNQSQLAAFNSSKAFKVPAPSLLQAPANLSKSLQQQQLHSRKPSINDQLLAANLLDGGLIGSNGSRSNQQNQDINYQPNMGRARIRECTEFTYELALDQGRTMTSEFDLVCDREWLRSFFQSLLSAAIVVAHVFWGTFSDKYGRYQAQRLCLVVSLAAGLVSIFAVDFWTFTCARALCSLGDLGLVVSMTTTVVELVGSRYRGLSVALVNFGYALGVTLLPYIVAYFEDFRLVVSITVLCHLITMPIILTTNESIRWLITNRKFKTAKREMWRIVRWNNNYSMFCRRFYQSQSENYSIRISANKELARARCEREKFEQMFEQFVQLIEAQNLCDPMQSLRDDPLRDIEQTDAEDAIRELNYLAGRQEQQVDLDHVAEITTDHQQYPRCTFEQTSEGVGAESWFNKRNATFNKYKLSRTVSCIELSNNKDIDPESPFVKQEFSLEAEGKLQRPYKQKLVQDKFKRLTLPVGSNLIYLEECHQDNSLDASRLQHLDTIINRQQRQQPDCINLVANQLSFMGRVSRLFKDKKLMIAVFTIVWTTFNSELQYTSFIIINLEVGEDLYLNYILGGCMEALAAISASLLLSYAPRRHSLIAFWLLISLSCFGLSIAHIDSTWAVWLLALAKFSQSCLSSIASVAAYESFPTFLRQSGSGLVFTLGMLGSVFAPLIFAEFDDQAGMDRVLMTFSLSSLTAAALIYWFLNETRNCELQ